MANPRIGQTATLNGKTVVWSGNHGWQSPASHNKLKEQGKFRVGTQALDRLASSANRALEKHAPGVKKHFENVAADQQRSAQRQDKQIRQTAGNRVANAVQQDATGKVLDKASKVTNVDRRIVGAAATAAQAAIGKAALGTAKPNRSVGAAANPSRTTAVGPRIQAAAAKKAAAEQAARQAQTQRLKDGVRGAATRQGTTTGKATAKVNVSKPAGKDGNRLFTPANRAKVVQRQNANQARSQGFQSGDGTRHFHMDTNGMSSTSRVSPRFNADQRNTRGGGSKAHPAPNTTVYKRKLNKDHDISFKESKADAGDYRRGREYGGGGKESRVNRNLKSANVQDQLGHHMSRVRTGDHVRATPINDVNRRTGDLAPTSARARYYSQKSNKALASTKYSDPEFDVKLHDVNARRGPGNKWTNPANSKDAGKGRVVQRDRDWDPSTLHEPLNKLANSKATLVGKRAGGNSNVKASIKPKQPTAKSVGAAARSDVAGSNGRRLYTPKVDGVVSKSGQKVGGRVAPYTVRNGSRTVSPTTAKGAKLGGTKKTQRLTSPATPPNRSNGNLASSGRPKYKTKNAITGRSGKRVREALDSARAGKGLPRTSSATRSRFAEGTRRNDTVAPPRSRTTRPTRTEQVRTVKSGLRDRGSQHVRETLRGQNAAGQARGNRYSTNRGGGTMTTYGETNARRSANAQQRSDSTSRRTSAVRDRSRDAGRQAVDRFEGRARQIVNDRIRREGENMTSRERQALTRSLQRQMRQGSNRVRAAAEGQSTRSQNETRSNTRNFTGTGRQAYQETNRMDRRGGRSEAQYRARAGRVRTTQGERGNGSLRINPRAASNNPRVSPAVDMRRRRQRRNED
jgi:hypothetical protein